MMMIADFEISMIRVVKEQTPHTMLLGCFHHFEDAMQRKLGKLRVPENQISKAMQPETLDFLTPIKRNRVTEVLQYICSIISDGRHAEKWVQYTQYFMNV